MQTTKQRSSAKKRPQNNGNNKSWRRKITRLDDPWRRRCLCAVYCVLPPIVLPLKVRASVSVLCIGYNIFGVAVVRFALSEEIINVVRIDIEYIRGITLCFIFVYSPKTYISLIVLLTASRVALSRHGVH